MILIGMGLAILFIVAFGWVYGKDTERKFNALQ